MRRILSIVICICMIFAVQMPVGFAAVNPAESDILFEDDFEDYAEDATSVDKSVKGWTDVSGSANQKLVSEENGNHYIRFNATVADTEAGIGKQQYPAINKVIAAVPGDTIAVAASAMVTKSTVNSGISYLQLRETTGEKRRFTVNNFSTSSITFCDASTGYKAADGKWINYEIYVKIAAAGSLSDIVMKMYGDGVVDASGNAVSEDNPVILRKQASLDNMSIDANSNVRVLFNNNIGLSSITNDSEENHAYVGLDNVVIFSADTAFDGSVLSDLKVNGETVSGFDSSITEYDVKVAHDADASVIEALAAEGSEIVISDNNITEFPATVTVTVTNAIGLSSTYTLNLTKKRSETEVETYLEKAYGGADSIISMTFDDGIYDTAVFINEQFKKYDLRGSIMSITSRIETEELRSQWLELLDDGYLDVQSHSSTHKVLPSDGWAASNGESYLENNTEENYQYEIVDSKASLEEWVLNDVTGFAASNNTLSDGAWEVVKDTYYAARLGSRGYNTLDPDEGIAAGSWYNLKMQGFYDVSTSADATKAEKIAAFADKAVTNEAWLVTMCHSIQENAGDATMAEAEYAFRRIAQLVNDNKVWCTTFGDAIKYVRERQNSVAYADLIDNQVTVEVVTDNTNIPAEIFNHPLTVKAEVPSDWSMVSYSVGSETETAKVFEEDGITWAYVNVLPNTKTIVTDAGTSNKLSGIAVGGIKIEGFDSETYEYNLSYYKEELPLSITAQAEAADAVIAISDESIETLPAAVTVSVTDGNGEEQVYTLNITRTPSKDATLASLKVNGVDIEGFAADTYSYEVEVDAASVAVTAEANDENASVTVDKQTVSEFPATVNVTVTAEDKSKAVYSVVVLQVGGDEIILDDDYNSKTVGYSIGSKGASSTTFAQGSSSLGESGVKAVKDETSGNIYGQFYYDADSGVKHISHAAYTNPGLTGTIIVKGKAAIVGGTSTHDVHIRAGSSTTVSIVLNFDASSNIKIGSTTVGKYTRGEWVDYTLAIREDTENAKYIVEGWFTGEGITDTDGNALSGPLYGTAEVSDNGQSLAATSGTTPRIVYRGVTSAGYVINLDDAKIYKQGNFHIKSASESVDLDNGEKLNIKVNHDMAIQNVTADSITAVTESGISAKIASVEKVSTTELNIVFDESTVAGEYTISFGDTFTDIAGLATSDTVKVTVKNEVEDSIILEDNFNTKTEGYQLKGKSGTTISEKKVDSTRGAIFENGTVKYFSLVEGLQYNPVDIALGGGITAPLVVKGKTMIPAGDTNSSSDVLLRAQKKNDDGTYATDYGMVNLVAFGSDSNVKVGSASGAAKYTKGKWVDYTIVLKENKADLTYSLDAWLGGEGILDADGKEVSEPIYINTTVVYDSESISTTDSNINPRISYRGIIYSSEDITDSETTVFMDDWKIYTIGKFELAEVSESVDLNKTNKITVKTNHDIDTESLTAENVAVTTAEGNSATVTAIEKVSMTEFNIVLDENTQAGEYTVAFTGVKDVAGTALKDTANVVLKKLVPTASVAVAALNGTITADIGGELYNWQDLHTESFDVGESIVLTAVAEGNNNFMYWINAASDRIISKEESYSFILGSNISLKAIFASEESYFVAFTNANGQVLAASDSGETVVPDEPYIGGYEFDGWYLDGEKQSVIAGDTVTAANKDLNYQAGFKKSVAVYSVTLINANEENDSYMYNDKVTVTAKDRSSEGLVFTYWKKNNAVVSYNSVYSFYVSGDETLEACYAQTAEEKEVIIAITSRQIDSGRMGFFTEYDLSDEYTVVESGILMGESAGLTLESAPIKAVAVNKNNKGQFTVRKAGLSAVDIYYGRGYLIYTDGSEVYTIYSDELAAEME